MEIIKERASDKVFNYIQERILNGTWQAGDKITPELQLVEELGVSRMSVREAIEKLSTLNILVKKRGGGTFVNELNPGSYMGELLPLLMLGKSSYREIMEFRSAIDTLSVNLFVKNMTDEDLKELEEAHEEMKNNRDCPNVFFEQDMKFHRIIAKGSKNSILLKIVDIIFSITKTYSVDQYNQLTPEKRIEEHSLILEAIKNRDAQVANIYMKRHIDRTIHDLDHIKD